MASILQQSQLFQHVMELVILFLIYNIRGGSTQSLPCSTASGDNCTSSICPNIVVTYTCIITSGHGGLTDWILPTGTCPSYLRDMIRLSQYLSGHCGAQGNSTCGPYRAYSILPSSDSTYCLSSILTMNITAAMNGTTVTCFNTNYLNASITTLISSTTISVTGPPGAPNVIAKPIDPDMVLVVVNPSSSGGLPTSYNVTISNSSDVYTKSIPAGSAMVIFTGLTNTATYTISAVAINCAGSSNPATIISMSWPAQTTSSSQTSSATSTSPTSTPTTFTGAPNIVAIIGEVVGGVVILILIIAAIILYCFLCLSSCKCHPMEYASNEESNFIGTSKIVLNRQERNISSITGSYSRGLKEQQHHHQKHQTPSIFHSRASQTQTSRHQDCT